MKISCLKSVLNNNINIVSKAVSSKTTLPILEYILFVADDNGFRLLANDLKLAIETSNIESIIHRKGVVALEAKMFSEIARKLPDGEVTIEVNDDCETLITCNRSKFTIKGLPGEDFPMLPNVDSPSMFRTNAEQLKDMIKRTVFSVAQDETKPVLTGELLEVNNGYINFVAVDGFRISYIYTPTENNNDISIVIPAQSLKNISSILPSDKDCNIDLHYSENHVMFITDEFKLVSRLLSGEFIKYKQIFNDEYTTKITIDKSNLKSSLERALLVAKDTKRTPVKFEIRDSELIITSNTEIGECYEEVAIQTEGNVLEIAFNPTYILDTLNAITDEDIVIQFTTPLSPCIIRGVEESDYKYLVLPLRLKG